MGKGIYSQEGGGSRRSSQVCVVILSVFVHVCASVCACTYVCVCMCEFGLVDVLCLCMCLQSVDEVGSCSFILT